MNQYRYTLDPTPKKYLCPNCGKKRLVAYIDTKTKELLPNEYGRCDREVNCGYHLNPYESGYAQMIWQQENGQVSHWQPKQLAATPPKPLPKRVFMPWEVLQSTLRGYDQNAFVQNLANNVPYPLPVADIEKVIAAYYLGTVTSGYMAGAVCFPFIDQYENIRVIQAKKFDVTNHSIKGRTTFIHALVEQACETNKAPLPDWLVAYKQNDKKVSCLFGEHLLSKYPDSPIALVEAPKTAIYGSLYFGLPDEQVNNMLWLAVYNLSSLTLDRCQVLQNRDVYLFPDLSADGKAFSLWQAKAQQLETELPYTRFVVSDLLENNATPAQKKQGLDLADYLIKLNWQEFRDNTPSNNGGVKGEKSASVEKPFFSSPSENLPLDDTGQKLESSTPSNNGSVKGEKSVSVEKPFFSSLPENLSLDDTGQEVINDNAEAMPPWDIEGLESFFAALPTLPSEPIQLNQGVTISNVQTFINGHLAVLKANNGKEKFKPYFERLERLKALLLLLG